MSADRDAHQLIVQVMGKESLVTESEARRVLESLARTCKERSCRFSAAPLQAVRIDNPGEHPDLGLVCSLHDDSAARRELTLVAMQAMPALRDAGYSRAASAEASIEGQFLMFVTMLLEWETPHRHGPWVNSRTIDPNEEVFWQIEDVFAYAGMALEIFLARHLGYDDLARMTEGSNQRLPARSGSGDDQRQWFNAAWYDKATAGGLYAGLLRMAAKRESLKTRKEHKRLLYQFSEVGAAYPQYLPHLEAALKRWRNCES